MIQIKDPINCCGCTACASICNHNAITMEPDTLGFLYPKINIEKCVNCKLCDNICSFNINYDTSLNFKEPIAYGARHKNINEIIRSRSGAVFVAISDYILENGGIIYGVGFTDNFQVIHKRATTKSEREEFRGSKYVQSDLRNIFPRIKKDLIKGKKVLFVGTACQTAGLNKYIGKKLRSNLILVDIICHGVPSPFLWRDYITYLENKVGYNINQVNFRDKSILGWTAHCETFKFENGFKIVNKDSKFYKRSFFRKSCSICHFCNTRRPSDITLGDFWGWEKENKTINKDNKGLNIVFINTLLGLEIFEIIKKDLIVIKAQKSTYMQPNLKVPTKSHPYRDLLEEDYKKNGFEYVFFHDYDNPTILDKIRRRFIIIKKYIKR